MPGPPRAAAQRPCGRALVHQHQLRADQRPARRRVVLALDGAVRQINCPSLNLRPAVEDVARRYHELIVNPVVPSFNGILARLLLDCHLYRCGLPPALFNPAQDRNLPADVPNLLRRLLDRIIESYEALLAARRRREQSVPGRGPSAALP